jgi:hypothetical protein
MAPKKTSDQGVVIVPPDQTPPDPVATADYIAAMTNEFAALSRRSGLDLLAYFLDIARLEALEQARRNRTVS